MEIFVKELGESKKYICDTSSIYFSCILKGEADGIIWANRKESPKFSLVWSPYQEGFQLIGQPLDDMIWADFRNWFNTTIIPFLNEKGLCYFEYGADTKELADMFQNIFEDIKILSDNQKIFHWCQIDRDIQQPKGYLNTKYKEDIKEYCRFAQKVLKEYEIYYDDISFLQKSENVTFCIEKKSINERYLLRIHKSVSNDDTYQNNKGLINSELLLLQELNSYELFTVQVPVKNRYGSFVTKVFNEFLGKDLNVTVLRWIEGETIDINNEKYNGLAFKLGEEMAKLHKYLNQWEVPDGFIRTEYDLETSKANLSKLEKIVDIEIICKMKYNDIYKNTMEITEFIEKNLSKDQNCGLIHGDLNECNYLTNGEVMSK